MALEALFNSAGPLVVTAREALEAALIVGVIATYLKKTGRDNLNRYLYFGITGAVLTSVLLGAGIALLRGNLPETLEAVFAGTASITATLVLTYMIFWMARNSRKIRSELESKIESSASKGYLFGIAVVAFAAVAREGLETVLFLSAFAASDATSTVFGAIAGVMIVTGLSIAMMKGVYRLNVSQFFKYTSIILVVFAAGIFASGAREFIEVGEETGVALGLLATKAYDLNIPDSNLMGNQGALGSILKAVFGYRTSLDWFPVIVYFGYWLMTGLFLYRTYWSSARKSLAPSLTVQAGGKQHVVSRA